MWKISVGNERLHTKIFEIGKCLTLPLGHFLYRMLTYKSCELSIDKHLIEIKSECRFLGVIIDDKPKWTQHIAAVRAKMSRYLEIKSRLPIAKYASKSSKALYNLN